MTITEPAAGPTRGPATVGFTLNGAPVTVRADHPHLLAALREELDVTSPKDGCSPSGQCGCCTVLVDGRAVVACQQSLRQGRRAGRSRRWRASTPTSASATRTPSRPAGACSAASASPGIVVRAKAQIDKKGADLTRDDMARHLGRPPVPLHRLREGARRHRGRRRGQGAGARPRRAGSGRSGAQYEAAELTLGDRGYVDDLRVPGPAPRRPPPDRPRPRRCPPNRHRIGARARPAWWPSSPRRTSPARCGSASSTPTGRS